MWLELLKSLGETVYMVLSAGALAALFGIPLGTLLCMTQPNHLWPHPKINILLGGAVNILRSVPFIILMICLIPLTRLLLGTSIGTTATIVPLTFAAIPLMARLSETSLSQVPRGLLEAAIAMGADHRQIIRFILWPESASRLCQDITLTLINLVGASAMAGTLGGGGLGSLAIHYGYQRFDVGVMLSTACILVAVVQLIQLFGNALSKKLSHSS